MESRWQWVLRELARRLWVRTSLFSVLGVGTALLAILVRGYIPDDLPTKIGANAVDSILHILASSMLAVTTFSVGTVVAAYAAASSNVTPRATRLLHESSSIQNTLAVFIGTFLYSLVGIIALSTGVYGERGRVVLFVVTIGVIVVVVVTLLFWIDRVSRLGQVGDTTDVVEHRTAEALRQRRELPFLGGVAWLEADPRPTDAAELHTDAIGYLTHIDMAKLEQLARAHELQIHVDVLPGRFVDPSDVLGYVTGPVDRALLDALVAGFSIARLRSYDQDPRFGLAVLAEVGSRALSPALNDQGTAIDVIGRAVRLLSLLASAAPDEAPRHPHVHVRPLELRDLFDDVFTPLAREGAGMVEVAIRLQKALLALARVPDPRFARCAAHHAGLALARAEAVLTLPDDRRRVTEVAAQVLAHAAAHERT